MKRNKSQRRETCIAGGYNHYNLLTRENGQKLGSWFEKQARFLRISIFIAR